ncbi:MAG: trimethylamine methyltransferase family protein [Desulfobacterales bacterium]|jgi:trimethylamine:corrinoid methyltransferase-like protein
MQTVCRDEFFFPDLSIRTLHGSWLTMETREITARAGRLLEKPLAEYEEPEIDPVLEKELARYVANRK